MWVNAPQRACGVQHFFVYFFPFDWPVASHLFFCVWQVRPTRGSWMDLVIFFYVLRFGLISQQRACVIQRFYVCFSLGVIFFPFLFILFLRAFPVLVVADNGIILLLLNTVLWQPLQRRGLILVNNKVKMSCKENS